MHVFRGPDGKYVWDVSQRGKLRSLLCERRIRNAASSSPSNTTLMLNSVTAPGAPTSDTAVIGIAEFLSNYPRTPLDVFDRVLENIARNISHPTGEYQVLYAAPDGEAVTFSDDVNQAVRMLEQLSKLGYLEKSNSGFDHYMVTHLGWKRVAELKRAGLDSRQAFVAMWFDPSQTEFFDKGFRPAIEADGFTRALRIDGKDHNNKIDDEIVAEIRRSRYLVADFTGHRGGVYFEAGFALGLGLPVIWTCHESHIKDAHFDTRQYNHITYTGPEDLRVKLLNRIRATIS